MDNLKEIYADIILSTCLKIEKGQPLLICFNNEITSFARLVAKRAYLLGVTDIYFDVIYPELKHDALKNLEIEDLKKLSFWNKKIWDEYAKKDAAFLMLDSTNPDLMKDVDANKIKEMVSYSSSTKKIFKEKRDKSLLSWCIACVPTYDWAKIVFKNSANPVDDLWNAIFEICGINSSNPILEMNKRLDRLSLITEKLNKYNFKKLKYYNSLGTDFEVELPDSHIWKSGLEKLQNGKEILCNFPTEEVFTSPDYRTANGIVYSSKPLSYQGSIIDDFSVTFKDGKAISSKARCGDRKLKAMINTCKNSEYLGEVALVEYSSKISKSNLVFYETLYDENASCHIALGNSFPECIKDGSNTSREELLKKGLNNCDNHVDFMIGTSDLEVIGITHDNKEVKIFENGNFTSELKS